MNIQDLASKGNTRLQLTHPVSEEALDVYVVGFTPDSAEWRNLEKSIAGPKRKQSVFIEKGASRLELDNDIAERRRKLLVQSITSIEGLDDFDNDPTALRGTLERPEYSWIVDAWAEHVDDRANFFA